MSHSDHSLSIAAPHSGTLDGPQKATLALAALGVLALLVSLPMDTIPHAGLWLTGALLAIVVGVLGYAWRSYAHHPAGIKNNGVWHSSLTSRGAMAWVVGVLLTGFYVVLYFYPCLLYTSRCV